MPFFRNSSIYIPVMIVLYNDTFIALNGVSSKTIYYQLSS